MNHNIELLKYCLSETKGLFKEFLIKYMKKMGYRIEVKRYYILCVNRNSNLNVMLTAHYDTHTDIKKDRLLLYDEKQNVMWGEGGLGADDRAGIFAILEIVTMMRTKYVLFCDMEEKGGIGCDQFVKEVAELKDLNYILAFDRRGENNYVNYSDDSKELGKFITEFGFKEEHGSFSDLATLMPHLKVAGVNLSVGFWNEHRDTELLYINCLLETIECSIEILRDKRSNIRYEYIAETITYTPYNSYANGRWDNGEWLYNTNDIVVNNIPSEIYTNPEIFRCEINGDVITEEDLDGDCANCEFVADCKEWYKELMGEDKNNDLETAKREIEEMSKSKTIENTNKINIDNYINFNAFSLNDRVIIRQNNNLKYIGMGIVKDIIDNKAMFVHLDLIESPDMYIAQGGAYSVYKVDRKSKRKQTSLLL